MKRIKKIGKILEAFEIKEWDNKEYKGLTMDLNLMGNIEELTKKLVELMENGYDKYSIDVRWGYYDSVDGLNFEVSEKKSKNEKKLKKKKIINPFEIDERDEKI